MKGERIDPHFPYDTEDIFPYNTGENYDANRTPQDTISVPEDLVDQRQIVKKTLKKNTTNNQNSNYKHIQSSKKNTNNKNNKLTQPEKIIVCNTGSQTHNHQIKNASLAKYAKKYRNNDNVYSKKLYDELSKTKKIVKEKAEQITKLFFFKDMQKALYELIKAYNDYKKAYENTIKYETEKVKEQDRIRQMHKKNIRVIKQSQKKYLHSKNVLNSILKNLAIFDKFKQSTSQKKVN